LPVALATTIKQQSKCPPNQLFKKL